MASNRRGRSGQAMTEFAIALLAIILLIVAAVEFLPIFLENIGLLKEVREEAGIHSLYSETSTATADRQAEFSFEVPGVLPGDAFTSGFFAEKMRMPAANLACKILVDGQKIGKKLVYSNRSRTSYFFVEHSHLPPREAAIGAIGALNDITDWHLADITYENASDNEYAYIFYQGDLIAPSAVAAAHAFSTQDENGLFYTHLTFIARTVGGEL